MREGENFVVMQRSSEARGVGWKGDVVSVLLLRMPPPLFSFEGKRGGEEEEEGQTLSLSLSRSIIVKSGRSWGGRARAALKPTERVRTARSVLRTIWAARVRSARVPEILGQIRGIE